LVPHEEAFTGQGYHEKEVDDPFAAHAHRPHLLRREDGDQRDRSEAQQDHREVAEPRILRHDLASLVAQMLFPKSCSTASTSRVSVLSALMARNSSDDRYLPFMG